jgi:hypothetical protein
MIFVYRGISAKHPAWFAAWMGIAVPGDVNGTLTPEQHNFGGFEQFSPYTSWTQSRAVAEFHRDREGPGGLLLRVPLGAPAAGDMWRWEWSPDEFFEGEQLMRGVRIGIEVIL